MYVTSDSAIPLDSVVFICRGRIYANMDELYTEVAPDDEDPYGYGDESIYDSICYYQAPVFAQIINYD